MNKVELIANVAAKTQLSKSNVKLVLEGILDEVVESLKAKEAVQLIGFGTFKVTESAERTARNPHTGEKIIVPAHYVPKFKFSDNVSKEVRN